MALNSAKIKRIGTAISVPGPEPLSCQVRLTNQPHVVLWARRRSGMITGVHAIVFSQDADGVRAFFRDTLGLSSVDAGGGWLIFALPPAELGVHPTDEAAHHELYLMCDDIEATIRELKAKGVEFVGGVTDARFGRMTSFKLPGGTELALYQPKHPTAIQTPG
jgi:predicted enzyme related to lactoylglutathione lyase